ncbi:MAG: hypothetical protein WED07_01775 [Candidatus Freyarchaeum deiterrae]
MAAIIPGMPYRKWSGKKPKKRIPNLIRVSLYIQSYDKKSESAENDE